MSERFEDIFFMLITLLFMICGVVAYLIADYKISKHRVEIMIFCKELKNKTELYDRLKICENYVEKE